MKIKIRDIKVIVKRFFIKDEGFVIAKGDLLLKENDERGKLYGYIADLIIEEDFRDKGLGTRIVKAMIKECKKNNCYKIVLGTESSKKKVHNFYKKQGFIKWGIEFRIDF